MRAFLVLIALFLIFCEQITATDYTCNPGDTLQTTVTLLQPGDTLYLAPGTYSGEASRVRIEDKGVYHGSPYVNYTREHEDPSMWITIRAQNPEDRPILNYGGYLQNQIDLRGSTAFIKLIGLEITGSSDGIKAQDAGIHHLVIEDCYIHDVYSVGVGCQAGIKYLTVRNSEIARSGVSSASNGELMYLGSHDATKPMTDSLIEYNHVHGTRFTSGSDGDGIEIKRGGVRNVVRHNVIHDTRYPAIFSYGNTSTNPADANFIYGNVIYNSMYEGIQVCGNSAIYNNIIFNSGDALMCNVYSGSSAYFQNIRIFNNTFYKSSSGLQLFIFDEITFNSISSNAFYNNACYDTIASFDSPSSGGNAFVSNNAFGNLTAASSAMVAPSTTAGSCNFYPLSSGALVDAGCVSGAPADDFNTMPRDSSPDIGAYEFSGTTNPGWQISADFKRILIVGIEMTYPTDGAELSGTVVLAGTATSTTGDDVSLVEVRVNGGAWQTATGTTSWTYSLNTVSLSNGYSLIEARATDGTTVSGIVHSEVLINNTGGTIQTQIFADIMDSYVYSSEPDSVGGGVSAQLYTSLEHYALFRLNELAGIPDGSVVLSAVLQLHSSNHGGTPNTMTAYRLTKDWSDDTACWNAFSFPSDYESIAGSPTTAYSTMSGGWLEWNLTAYCQYVIDTGDNTGLIFVPNLPWDVNIDSTENSTASFRPYLDITYLEALVDNESPSPVSAFTATAGDEKIILDWDNPGATDFEGVIIRRSTTSQPTGLSDGELAYSGTGTTFTDTGLTNGVIYYYAAFAFDEVPNYSTAEFADAEPFDGIAPAPLASFSATGGPASIILSWTYPSDTDVVGVMVRISLTPILSPTCGTLAYYGSGTSTTISNLSETTLYYIVIFTCDDVPNYSIGLAVTATTLVDDRIPATTNPKKKNSCAIDYERQSIRKRTMDKLLAAIIGIFWIIKKRKTVSRVRNERVCQFLSFMLKR